MPRWAVWDGGKRRKKAKEQHVISQKEEEERRTISRGEAGPGGPPRGIGVPMV